MMWLFVAGIVASPLVGEAASTATPLLHPTGGLVPTRQTSF